MKKRDSSDSSGSDDIDLDEIAKMIDEIFLGDKLEERVDDEGEVLTSFSSNNGQAKSESLGKSWTKDLEKGNIVDSGGKFNLSARARRRNAKLGSGAESAIDGEFLASSNLETGLWSGDDLWKLNGKTVLNPPKSTKTSLNPDVLSPRRDSKGLTTTSPIGTQAKADNKPGKFDWLGLLDDESDEEKGESTGYKNQKVATSIISSAPKEMHPLDRLGIPQINLSSVDQDHLKVEKVPLSASKETKARESILNVAEPNVNLSKGSLSENVSSKKGGSKSSESEHLGFKNSESVIARPDVTSKTRGKSANISKVLMDDDYDDLVNFGQPIEGGVRVKLKGTSGEEDEKKEKRSETTVNPRRRSLLEDDERSAQSYTPTFLGGSPERPGRRRRKREGAEGLPSRSAINPDFDPLGLFSVDDNSSKVEDPSKSKALLPDWLTGSSKKLDVGKEAVSLSTPVKEVDGHGGLKEEEVHKDSESPRGSYGDRSKEVDSQLSKHSAEALSEAGQKTRGAPDSSEFITKVATESRHENIREDDDGPSYSGASRGKDDEKSSKNESDKSRNESPAHATSIVYKKESAVISETDEVSLKVKEKFPAGGMGMKDGEKANKKQHHKTSFNKSKVKKKHLLRDRVSNGDADLSSPSERTDSKSENIKQLALLERQYRRKVRELEEQAGRMEQLEEELGKMRYLEGEVEHLKAVVHVVELEKSAAEALVESLQARHSEQLNRLEDVHRNEVETLRKALLREEKRGAEEVKRLVEDHRKTLDRLMDANIKLEEEFRTRMLEARRDWGRDVEAMRVAYQQSNSAAITNASLAVLTGQSFGAEIKDKSEDDIKDESSAKALSQCPQEVKDLSQTVERVESILTQALEVMLPKAKPQMEEVTAHETEAQVKGNGHIVGSMRKHQMKVQKRRMGV
ncbi:uncharacterized protein [Hetaerina americana]|uniref:uncharacterized protein n=1 Tax=Hetaerina americana TaxID=62018 RepID=UPI003A7F110A